MEMTMLLSCNFLNNDISWNILNFRGCIEHIIPVYLLSQRE